jgi:hypothetical protein
MCNDCLAIPVLLQEILFQLRAIDKKVKKMSAQMENLVQQVAAIESVGDSAIALLTGLKAQLDAAIAANDPAALQALSDRLAAQTQELSEAVAENTVADPSA